MTEFRLLMQWDGEAFRPIDRNWAGRADKALVVGQRYFITEVAQRSKTSHDHFFAQVADVFANLPEHLTERFSDPDHLRAYALIKTGYFSERVYVASSKAEAQRHAAYVRSGEKFCVITISDSIVVERYALSQSYAAMGKKRFQESKGKVLDFLADLIGVSVADIKQSEPA